MSDLERAFLLFQRLLDVPEPDLEALLARECAESPNVAEEVRRLLREHRAAGTFLETSLGLDSTAADTTHSSVFSAGEIISNRFEIQRLSGRGGMGEVYEARDLNLMATVAIKTLRPDLAAYPWMVRRFRDEVLRARRVAHPNVCRVYDLFSHVLPDGSEIPFFTMQMLEGQTLQQWLSEHGPFSAESALPLIQDIASALQAAHDVKIVHRDLKPRNVFLWSDAGRSTAVVTDFGLAVRTEPGNLPEGTVTRMFATAGTPAYMAPEQRLGKPITTATDVYALGVVAHEMLTTTVPDSGVSVSDERVPLDWRVAINRCLRLNPDERYSRPADFVQALNSSRRPFSRLVAAARALGHMRAAMAILVLLMLGVFLFGSFGNRAPDNATTNAPSIAVLPFGTSDASLDYLAEGLADELSSALTSLPELHVAGRNSTFRLRDLPFPDAGKALGVKTLLTGSMSQTSDRILISVQLVEAATGRLLWSKPFDRDFRQLFAIEAEIITETAARLKLKLPDQPERHATMNIDSYDLYLKGRYFWNKRTEEGLRKALEYFEKATEKDPDFAAAYTGIADAYTVLADYGWISAADASARAGSAIQRSLTLQPNVAETHASSGLFNALVLWDQRAAESAFQKALALKPKAMNVHFWYGGFLMRAGRLDEALEQARLAQALDPVSPATVLFVAWVHYYRKGYAAAISVAKEVVELDPNYPHSHQLLALCYAAMGRAGTALEENAIALRMTNDAVVRLRYKAQVLSFIPEQRHEAHEAASRLAAVSLERQAGYLAVIYAALGDRNKMYEWLDRSLAVRDTSVLLANVASPLEPYRSEPRFRRALQMMGYLIDPAPLRADQ